MQRDTRSLVIARLRFAGGEMQLHEMMAVLRYREDGAKVLRELIDEGAVKRERRRRTLVGRRPTTFRLTP